MIGMRGFLRELSGQGGELSLTLAVVGKDDGRVTLNYELSYVCGYPIF